MSGGGVFFFGVVSCRRSSSYLFLTSQRLSRDMSEGSNFFELIRSFLGLESFFPCPFPKKIIIYFFDFTFGP